MIRPAVALVSIVMIPFAAPSASGQAAAPAGWNWEVKTIGGFSLHDRQEVVGQADGTTQVYNLKLDAGVTRNRPGSEWKNSVTIDEVFTRTPSLPRTVKTGDDVKLVSFYKYFFSPGSMFGLYGRGSAETSLLATYDERADETSYVVTDRDGTTRTETANRQKTAPAFKPATTKESAGVIGRFLSEPLYTLEVRTGPAAKQFYGSNSYAVSEDAETGVVSLSEIEDTRLAGVEAGTELTGVSGDKKFSYTLYAEALYPIAYSPESDGDPEGSRLIATEAGLDLTYAMLDWLGVSYNAKSKRDPLLKPEAQISHKLLATVTFVTGG